MKRFKDSFKKLGVVVGGVALGSSSAWSAPVSLPTAFITDLQTTASTFGEGGLALWGSVALAVLVISIFRKIF